MLTILNPEDISDAHRVRAGEIIEFWCARGGGTFEDYVDDKPMINLIELMAEGFQAIENNYKGTVVDHMRGNKTQKSNNEFQNLVIECSDDEESSKVPTLSQV